MTNEEKAIEIADKSIIGYGPSYFDVAEDAAFKMAEWKDQQYANIIKEECNTSYESGLAEGERKAEARFKEYLEKKKDKLLSKYFGLGDVPVINEIINDFFKEE